MNEIIDDEYLNFEEMINSSKISSRAKIALRIISTRWNPKILNQHQYDENDQLSDIVLELVGGEKINVEIKNRGEEARIKDVAIERYSSIKASTPNGWPFRLIEKNVTFVIYIWHEQRASIIFKSKELNEWWKQNYGKYTEIKNRPSRNKKGDTWTSSWSPVPVSDFPENVIDTPQTFWREN